VIPPVGTRYVSIDGGPKWRAVAEYVGPNPRPQYQGMDAHLIRTVSTFHGGPAVSNVTAVEERWFETHRRAA